MSNISKLSSTSKINSKTPISSVFDSIQTAISSLIKPICQKVAVSKLPDEKIASEISKAMKTHVIINPAINQAFNKIAVLSQVNPAKSFKELTDILFRISLSSEEPISKTRLPATHWISKLSVKETGNFSFRVILFYVVEYYLADIIYKILFNADDFTDISFLVENYLDDILQKISEPCAAHILIELTDKFELINHQLSLKAPVHMWNWVTKFLGMRSISQISQTFIYRSLRSITLEKVPAEEIDSKNALSAFQRALSLFATPQTLKDSIIAASLFFTAIAANLSILSQNKRPSSLLTVIFNSSVSPNNQRYPAFFPLLCTFFVLSDEGRVQMSIGQILATARRFTRQLSNAEDLIFYGMKRILSGPNYLPHCEEDSPVTLNWRADRRDSQELTHFFPIIMQCSSLESKASSELTGFLTQLAVNTIDTFTEQYINDLESKNFMKSNGGAVFEAGSRLILNGYTKLVPKYTDLCISLLSEFSNAERTTSIPGISTDVCEIEELYSSSAPIIPTRNQQVKMMTDVNQLYKTISIDSKEALTYSFKVELSLNNDCLITDSPLARCLAFIPILAFNKKLTNCVIERVFDKSAFISSLASRSLMLLAKKNQDKAKSITLLIMEHKAETKEQLFIIINLLKMILSVVRHKKVMGSIMEIIAPAIIVGLASISYEIRIETLKLIDLTPLKDFIEKKNTEITAKALKNIIMIFNSECDFGELQQLNFQNFREVASSKYEIIYHFYLSVFFQMVNESEEFKYFNNAGKAITNIFKEITQTLAQNSREHTLNAINLATFVVSSSEENNSIFILNKDFIPIIEKHIQKEPYIYVLYNFAASAHRSHALKMLDTFTESNLIHMRVFTFILQLYIQDTDFVSNPDTLKELLDLMQKVVEYFGAHAQISNEAFSPVKRLSPQLTKCLVYFMNAIETLCKKFYKVHSAPLTGFILHRPITQDLMNGSNWFFFMFNIICKLDSFSEKVHQPAKDAFAAFCSVNAIADDQYQLFIEQIFEIAPQNILACSNILLHSFAYLFEHFINNSIEKNHFFKCIAQIFPEPTRPEEDAQVLAVSASQKQVNIVEKSFTSLVYNHIGDLLALCFIFLSGERQGVEKDAQKVLYHLVLSGALIVNDPQLFDAIDYVNEKSFLSLIKLSEILSNAFSFCAEQFISRALSLIDGKSMTCYICLIQPWFKHVDLSMPDGKLIPETETAFQCYTSTTFLRDFIKVVCTPPLQPPAISLLETIIGTSKSAAEFVFVHCFSEFSDFKEQSKAVLLHICKKDKEFAMNAACYIQFKYWWYSLIKLGEYDKFFDFAKFINSMNEKEDDDESTQLEETRGYEENALFGLELCCELLPLYEEMRPIIIAFCVVNPRTEQTKKALLLTTGHQYPTIDDIQKAVKNKLDVFFNECFYWATSCGNTSMALEASKYATETITNATPDMVPHVLKAIKVVADTLRENSVPSEARKQRKALTKVLQGDSEVDLKLYYKYLAALLDLLGKLCKETKISNASIINAVCEFSACGETEYQPIFDSFVNACLRILSLPNDIKNSDVSGGIIIKIVKHNLFVEKKKSKRIIHHLFRLTSLMFKKKLFNLIFPRHTKFNDAAKANERIEITEKMQVAASIIWLIPFIAKDCTEEMFKEFSEIVESVLNISIDPIWTSFRDKGEMFSSAITKVIGGICKIAGPTLLSAVVKLFSVVINYAPRYAPSIYSVSYLLLSTTEVPCQLSLRRIAILALKEKEEKCSYSISKFLPLYSELCDNFDIPSFSSETKFPVKSLGNEYSNWSEGELPLYLIECSFFYLSTIENLREKCLNVIVSPFDRWSMLLFNVESQRISLTGYICEVPEITTETIGKFLGIINKQTSVAEDKNVSRRQSYMEVNNTEDNKSFLVVDEDTFLPSTEYINEVGFEITGYIF